MMYNTKTIDETFGYVAAMKDVIEYLSKKTEFNPDKRYIDAVELVDFCQEQSKKQSKQFTV